MGVVWGVVKSQLLGPLVIQALYLQVLLRNSSWNAPGSVLFRFTLPFSQPQPRSSFILQVFMEHLLYVGTDTKRVLSSALREFGVYWGKHENKTENKYNIDECDKCLTPEGNALWGRTLRNVLLIDGFIGECLNEGTSVREGKPSRGCHVHNQMPRRKRCCIC